MDSHEDIVLPIDEPSSSDDATGPSVPIPKWKGQRPTMLQSFRKEAAGDAKQLQLQYNKHVAPLNKANVRMNNSDGSLIHSTIPISIKNGTTCLLH